MNVNTIVSSISAIAAFPTAAVEACLLGELVEAVKEEALMRGISLPTPPTQIAKAHIPIDSLVAVSILCAIEPIIGCQLPESVVRAGGYNSVEDAIGQLLPRIEKEWMKRKGAKP